jgi:hypothetical protein
LDSHESSNLTAIRHWRIMETSGAHRDFHLYEADHGSAQR